MKPRGQRRIRIAFLRFRLATEKARYDFDTWGRSHELPEALACVALGAVLGGMLGWGF